MCLYDGQCATKHNIMETFFLIGFNELIPFVRFQFPVIDPFHYHHHRNNSQTSCIFTTNACHRRIATPLILFFESFRFASNKTKSKFFAFIIAFIKIKCLTVTGVHGAICYKSCIQDKCM